MAKMNPQGHFGSDWWSGFLPVLVDWQAIRTNQPGQGKDWLTSRAEERFDALQRTWRTCCEPFIGRDLADVTWTDVADFAQVAADIKAAGSPVFASKFCHFLLPRVFPVVDNQLMGKPYGSYEAYFSQAKEEWSTTPNDVQDKLASQLASAIGSALIPDYPMQTKLVELCLIGRHQAG